MQSVEWEEELQTEEKDGGSKKSGQDNMPDESQLAWVQLMRDARAKDQAENPQSKKQKKCQSMVSRGKL